jgi:hypothetical protein
MKPPSDLPPDVARLLEKREQEDRRRSASVPTGAAGSEGAAPAKPRTERRKRNRRKS